MANAAGAPSRDRAGAPAAATQRLEQRHRLSELTRELHDAEAEVMRQRDTLEAAQRHNSERAEADRKAARERRIAARQDKRPTPRQPRDDGEYLPVMQLVNSVLGKSAADAAPSRNKEDRAARVRHKTISSLHLLTSTENNDDDD